MSNIKFLNVEIRKELADKSHNIVADFIFETDDSKEKIKVVVVISEDYRDDDADYKNIIAEKLSSFPKSELEKSGYKKFYANSKEGEEALKIWAKENNI
jgi:hypothetical protein